MCNALTVTKRESAPLPERLCERIAYCAILLTVYEADYSVVVALRIPLYSITDWHRSPISDSHPFDQPGT